MKVELDGDSCFEVILKVVVLCERYGDLAI